MESELSTSSTRFNELNQQLEAERAAFLNDKKALEETIVDMSSNAANVQTDEAERAKIIQSIEERAAVSICVFFFERLLSDQGTAQASQECYERELLAHADAVKHNEQLKEQVSTLKTQIREHENASETARSMLSTAEASWQTQRAALDKEISDLASR